MIISEYTGGGFGSKIPGAISMAIPALLSKKANAPVMMRITREDEHFIGRARPGILARVKLGMRKDGRITAIDMYAICDNGPYDAQGDGRSAGTTISLAYQPETMRWRGLTVLTNTPPKTSQRAPGGVQGIGLFEPILSKAAKKLGLDQVAVRRINAPAGNAPFGPALPNGKQAYVTSAFVKEALDKGRELFQWDAKKAALQRQEAGTSGARHRRRGQPVLGRLDRLRRPVHHQAGRPHHVPVGHRQPRHALGVRRASPGRGNARPAVGACATSSSATRRRTCRGPASRPAARPRTR